jgi:hypothetical protein
MQLHDAVVGAVSAAFGLFLLAGALLDGRWLMELRRPQMLTATAGKPAARALLALLGLALIALGGLIASGWRMHWT